jgi:O-antigen ligase
LVLGSAAVLLSFALNLPELVVASLGRDLTLTDRTFIWHDLLGVGTNPVFGIGYDTFWLGERLEWFLEKHQVNSAHNGYLEAYLEVGWIGLLLLVAFLITVFAKVKRALESDVSYGRLLAATLAVFLFYNVTEAGYKPTTLVCFMLLLVAMTAPVTQTETLSSRTGARELSRPRRATMRPGAAKISSAAPRDVGPARSAERQ